MIQSLIQKQTLFPQPANDNTIYPSPSTTLAKHCTHPLAILYNNTWLILNSTEDKLPAHTFAKAHTIIDLKFKDVLHDRHYLNIDEIAQRHNFINTDSLLINLLKKPISSPDKIHYVLFS